MEVDNAPPFDLPRYVANITGHGKIQRLLHVARSQHQGLRQQAFELAIDELRHRSVLTERYKAVCKQARDAGVPGVQVDETWVQQVR